MSSSSTVPMELNIFWNHQFVFGNILHHKSIAEVESSEIKIIQDISKMLAKILSSILILGDSNVYRSFFFSFPYRSRKRYLIGRKIENLCFLWSMYVSRDYDFFMFFDPSNLFMITCIRICAALIFLLFLNAFKL